MVPLFNSDHAAAPNLDWIGESFAETIQESLSSAGLLVLAREDREEIFKRLSLRTGVVLTKASVVMIGERLDAGQVIYGDFKVAAPGTPKSELHLTVRMIDLKRFREGPEITQIGPLETLSQMETKLAWLLIRQLAPEQAPAEEQFFRLRPPVRVEALESYVRGLMTTNPDQKTKLFTQAIRIDEKFSQPAFQLGRMLFLKGDYRSAAQWLTRVTAGDSHFLEGSFLRAICRFHGSDTEGAATVFRAVLAEIPLNEVYNNLGAALSRRNDPTALENFSKALEGDESDPDYWFNVGYALWKQGKFDLAADKFRAVLDRAPSDTEATTFLGRCIKRDGPHAGDARTEGRERIKTAFEDSAWRQLQAELHK